MANIDYNEILLNAIDAVVVSRIADVNFDRTVTCTIVDATNADSGIYTVNDGSVEFTAESENSKYHKNDCVNVLIPGNDYSNTKTILGKVSKDKGQRPITYVPPTDKIVPMSDNLAVLSTQKSLIANGAVQEIELTTHNISTDTLPTINFDTLCVSADFKTLMGDYDMRDGNFGLRVDLITDKNNIYTLLLDSKKDMFGNPYAYSSYFNQEQTYHLNLEENIVRIKTYLYQLGNFKYNDGINAGLANLEPANYNNIFINNVLVTFGYNAEQIEDNTVKIDTPSDKTYNNITNEGLGKKLILTWFNKDGNNEYIGFTDGNFGSEEDAKTANKNTYYIKWEHSKNNGSWEPINNAANLSSFELEVDPTKSINDYRAYVIFNGSSYMSNTISFRAETGYDSNIKEQLNMALTIEHGENSLDSYPLYGPDSALVNTGESSKPREVYFSYKSSVGGTLEPDILNGATAYLYIPTISTMLEQPYDGWSRKVGENDAANIEGYAAYCKTYIDEFSAQDGENLLRNTAPYELAGAGMGYDYEKQISEWSGNKSVFARATDGGKKTVMLKNTSSSEQVMSAEQKITLKSNTTYTISGSIYPTSAIEPKFILGYSDSNKIETAIEPYANDGTWKHFSITFTTGVVEEKVSIGFSAKIKSKKYVLWYKLMLVEGVKAKEWSYGAGDAEKIKNRAKTFRYRIKDIYNPLFANNEILLKIVDKNGYKYSTTKQFGFSSHGTSGTDYSLIIEDPINKKATLYDANYKPIKIEFADNDWSYWPKPLGQNETRTAAASYLVRKLTTKVNWVGGDVNLEALKGVSWAPEDSNYYYQGPTTIVYDSNGVNPKYYNGDIGLFDKNTNQLVEGITWALRYYTADKLNKDPLATISINGYPELTQADSGSLPRLKASNMYLTPSNGNEYYLVLVGIKDSNAMWRQPLIITQNQYASSVLNNWDGSLVINQEENTVLTAMIGAGSKNTDNEFSGVVMGEFSKLEGDKSIPQSSGLLGFHNGVQSFGFKTNGTAFIGKSGAGRIEFDGSKGVIQSAKYGELNASGSKWDLANGSIILNGSGGEYFKFNEKNDGKLEMKLSGADIVLSNQGDENLTSYIVATANSITQKVESMAAMDYVGTAPNELRQQSSQDGYYLNIDIPEITNASDTERFSKAIPIFRHGTLLEVTFTKASVNAANTKVKAKIWLNILKVGEGASSDNNGYPIWVNGAVTSTDNPLEWNAGDKLWFKFILTEAKDPEKDFNQGYWVVYDPYGVAQLEIKADNINASVLHKNGTNTGTGFGWNLTDSEWKVGAINNNVLTPTLTVNKDGLKVNGHIIATSIDLSQSSNKINAKYTDGFADVAISGSYNDLSDQPSVPKYVADLKDGGAVITTSKVTVETSTDNKGVTKTVSKIGDVTYTTYTADADDYVLTDVGIGTSSGDHSGKFVKLSKEGLLTADNAIIYGELHATSGAIGGWGLTNGTLISAYKNGNAYYGIGLDANKTAFDKNYRVFAIGQLSPANSNDYTTSWINAAFSIKADGSLYASNADITGDITAKNLTIQENAIIKGTLSANNIKGGSFNSGSKISLGGWNIGDHSLYSSDTGYGVLSLYNQFTDGTITANENLSSENWRILVKYQNNYTFGVTREGFMSCGQGSWLGNWMVDSVGNLVGKASGGEDIIKLHSPPVSYNSKYFFITLWKHNGSYPKAGFTVDGQWKDIT